MVLVPIDDVLFFKAELKYLTVRTAQREYLLEESLTKIEEEFGGMFTRIHRNAIVATQAITGFERAALGAEDGDEAADTAETGGGAGLRWVCVIKGVNEKLPVSRRQQHIIREL